MSIINIIYIFNSVVAIVSLSALSPALAQEIVSGESSSKSATRPERMSNAQIERQKVICGPNCLYMLLSLHNKPVDQSLFVRYFPTHQDGLSLLELQEAATSMGLPSEVLRCTYDELQRSFDSPIIAYLSGDGPHYVVVHSVDSESVSILDGTTGEEQRLTRKEFERTWSGYILHPREASEYTLLFYLSLTVLGWSLLLAGIRFRATRKRT